MTDDQQFDLYTLRVKELASNIPLIGKLKAPDATGKAQSRICGSQISVDIKCKDQIIIDYRQDVKACMLGACSASIVGENIIGASIGEITSTRKQLLEMLTKDEALPPEGHWSALKVLQPAKAHKQRHSSILLVFDAVIDAAAKIENS